MLGFPETLQQHSPRILAAVPVSRAHDPEDKGVRGAGGWIPWGALGKQRPVLMSTRSGPCLPYPIAKELQQRTKRSPPCLSMCLCMSMGSYGRECTCVCVYLVCMSIHLCMRTYEFILTQEAKRQEKGPHLLPTSSRLSPQVCLII